MTAVKKYLNMNAGSTAYGMQPAVTRSLLGLWQTSGLTGDTTGAALARALRPLWGSIALTATGTPVVTNNGYASLTASSNYFAAAGIPDQLECTLFAVGRATSAPAAALSNPLISAVGQDTTTGSNVPFGSSLNFGVNGAAPDAFIKAGRGLSNGTTLSQGGATQDVPLANTFKFYTAVLNKGGSGTVPGLFKVYDMTDNTSNVPTITSTILPVNSQTHFTIGSSTSSSTLQGTVDVAVAGIASVGWTDAEVLATYQQWKSRLQTLFPSTFTSL